MSKTELLLVGYNQSRLAVNFAKTWIKQKLYVLNSVMALRDMRQTHQTRG